MLRTASSCIAPGNGWSPSGAGASMSSNRHTAWSRRGHGRRRRLATPAAQMSGSPSGRRSSRRSGRGRCGSRRSAGVSGANAAAVSAERWLSGPSAYRTAARARTCHSAARCRTASTPGGREHEVAVGRPPADAARAGRGGHLVPAAHTARKQVVEPMHARQTGSPATAAADTLWTDEAVDPYDPASTALWPIRVHRSPRRPVRRQASVAGGARTTCTVSGPSPASTDRPAMRPASSRSDRVASMSAN